MCASYATGKQIMNDQKSPPLPEQLMLTFPAVVTFTVKVLLEPRVPDPDQNSIPGLYPLGSVPREV